MAYIKISLIVCCILTSASCSVGDTAESANISAGIISGVIAFLTVVASILVFVFQNSKHQNETFIKYAEHLHSADESDRVASAILLRHFIKIRSYNRRTVNLIASLLKILPNGILQKTLGDGLSYAKKSRGQDFQKANLHDVLIKPKKYIRYDMCRVPVVKQILKASRIKLKGADFFQANLSQFNANGVNFKRSVFYEANVCRARFRNCILSDANFCSANIDGARFYDCALDGACFLNAKRIETALVYNRQHKKGTPLLEFLDKDGYYHASVNEIERYKEDSGRKTIFISKLGEMNSSQQIDYDRIVMYLKNQYDLDIVYLDRCNYMKYGQLSTIHEKMACCAGAVVFAFSYNKFLETDTDLKNTETRTSPWLQIETAFANSMSIPTLIIMEKGVASEGIFDDKIVGYDALLSKFVYYGSLTETDKEAIEDWYNIVLRHK